MKLFITRNQVEKNKEEKIIMYKNLSEDELNYFRTRLDDQINWYDVKSVKDQKNFKKMKLVIILSSSLIPFLVAFNINNIYMRICIGILGLSAAILESIINLNKYNENWIEYRSRCETLKHEKYMFLYKTGVYEEHENRFKFFVERIETIISQENINWANLNNDKGGNK